MGDTPCHPHAIPMPAHGRYSLRFKTSAAWHSSTRPLELPLLLLLKQLVHPLSSLEGKSPGLSERFLAKQSQKASSRMRLEVVKVVKVVAKLETFGNNIGIKMCARLEDIEDSRQSCGFQVTLLSGVSHSQVLKPHLKCQLRSSCASKKSKMICIKRRNQVIIAVRNSGTDDELQQEHVGQQTQEPHQEVRKRNQSNERTMDAGFCFKKTDDYIAGVKQQ